MDRRRQFSRSAQAFGPITGAPLAQSAGHRKVAGVHGGGAQKDADTIVGGILSTLINPGNS